MFELKTVYKGIETRRKTEKLRQTYEAIDALFESGINVSFPEYRKNHESAHINAFENGRKGFMSAHVLKAGDTVVGWGIKHNLPDEEREKITGREMLEVSVAPLRAAFRKPVWPLLSGPDIVGAGLAIIEIGLEKLESKKK